MHPFDQNKIEAITSYAKSTAIDLPKLHEKGSAVRKIREVLAQLTDLYQQHSENFSPDQQKIVAAYIQTIQKYIKQLKHILIKITIIAQAIITKVITKNMTQKTHHMFM
jgi:hypothetical protein